MVLYTPNKTVQKMLYEVTPEPAPASADLKNNVPHARNCNCTLCFVALIEKPQKTTSKMKFKNNLVVEVKTLLQLSKTLI